MFNLSSSRSIVLTGRRRTPFAAYLAAVFATARQRRQLTDMDTDRLADMGITPTEAAGEADKPFWDVPSHWMR